MTLSSDGISSDPLEKQLRQACSDLDRRLRAGEACRAEAFLAEHPELGEHPDLAVELIYNEFVIREELGEEVSAENYYQRFPQWQQELHEQFEVHALLEDERGSRPLLPPHPQEGELWEDRYEIENELGRGGMAIVLKARDQKLNRPVALKVLISSARIDQGEWQRFQREAEAVAGLQHPHIVQIYEVGEHVGWPFLALEFVDGISLAEQLSGTRLPPEEAARLTMTLARAMEVAHRQGLVHRDLKPSNVLLTADGTPKIADFGLARRFDQDSGLTRSDAFVGTPRYMAPEQAGVLKYLGPASDVYSLGAILFECLTGQAPFDAETPLAVARKVLQEDPLPLRQLAAGVPQDLEVICHKCLEKEPSRRYPTAEALAADLQRFLEGKPIEARPITTLERLAKWSRRHPAVAALYGAIATFALLLLVVSLWYTAQLHRSNQDLAAALSEVDQQRASAQQQAELYRRQLDQSQRGLYAMQLAQVHDLADRDPSRGLQLLTDAKSCPPELRDFTWRYLYRLCDRSRWQADAGETVQQCLLSPDGRQVALRTAGEIQLRDAESGGLVWKAASGNDVAGLAFSAEGKSLEVARESGRMNSLKLASGEEVSKQSPLPDENHILHVAAEQGVYLTLDPQRAISCFGLQDRRRLWSQPLPNEAADIVRLAVASADGPLAAALEDGFILLWQQVGESPPLRLEPEAPSESFSLAFSPDGKLFAHGGKNEVLTLWNVADGKQLRVLEGHASPIVTLAFSPDGQRVASASQDRTVRVWNLKTGEEVTLFRTPGAIPQAVAFLPQQRGLMVGTAEGTLYRWQLSGNAAYQPLTGHAGRVLAIAFSPDGKWLASGSYDETLRIWSVDSRQAKHIIPKVRRIRQIAFAPSGEIMATASEDHTVKLWHPASGELLRTLKGHKAKVFSVAFRPDGKRLASASDDNTVRLWNVADGKPLDVLQPHRRYASAVDFSPDGRWLATAGRDGGAKIYNAINLQPRHSLQIGDWVHAVAFSPDGTRLLTGDSNFLARVWDVESGDRIATLRGHSVAVLYAAYTPDGQTIATAAGDRWAQVRGNVKLWDPRTGHLRITLRDQHGPVAFSPKGTWLATGTESGEIRLWEAIARHSFNGGGGSSRRSVSSQDR